MLEMEMGYREGGVGGEKEPWSVQSASRAWIRVETARTTGRSYAVVFRALPDSEPSEEGRRMLGRAG